MAMARAAEPAYGIARLIGEGYGKPDGKDETPIDIQYAKIAEWLVRFVALHVRDMRVIVTFTRLSPEGLIYQSNTSQ